MALQLTATYAAGVDWQQLRSAIETGDLGQIEQMFVTDSLINFVGDHGVTPLLHAVRLNRLTVVRSLIERGARVNAVRSDGFTPLLLATFFGYSDVLHVLVESGADVHAKTRSGTSAQRWATARGFYDIAEYLRHQQDKGRQIVVRPLKNNNHPAPQRAVLDRNHAKVGLKPALESTPPLSIVAPAVAATGEAAIRSVKSGITECPTVPRIVRTLKDPPEIWDLVHESRTEFHSGSAFLSRIKSAKPKTILLALAVILIVMGTFAGLGLKRSKTTEIAAPSGSAVTTNAGDAFTKTETNRDPMPSEQTKTFMSPNEDSVVKETERTASSQDPLVFTQSELIDTHSLVRPKRMSRHPRTSATAQEATRVNQPIPVSEDVNKNSLPQTSPAVVLTSNEIRATENSLPVKKATPLTTNSQLITRPFGSRVKPKTIQWP